MFWFFKTISRFILNLDTYPSDNMKIKKTGDEMADGVIHNLIARGKEPGFQPHQW
jgi:hypothetical protein